MANTLMHDRVYFRHGDELDLPPSLVDFMMHLTNYLVSRGPVRVRRAVRCPVHGVPGAQLASGCSSYVVICMPLS